MILGFTGTRKGMTPSQANEIREFLRNHSEIKSVHHGCCIGADSQFHRIVRDWDSTIPIIGHRATGKQQDVVIALNCDRREDPLHPLTRNKRMVEAVTMLIATPNGRIEQLRSGTWSTIRYARKTDTPIRIFWP